MTEEKNEGVTGIAATTEATKPKPKKKLIVGIVAGVVLVAAAIAILFATHVLCIHEWQDATCTEPQICGICERTQGEPLGHEVTKWTITKEPTCAATGIRTGNCERCGKQQSEQMDIVPHSEGDWEVTKAWTLNSAGGVDAGEQAKKCTFCKTVLKTEVLKPELTTAEEGACKLAMQMLFGTTGMSRDFLIQQLESQGFTTAETMLAVDHCGADWNAEAVKSAKFYLQTSGGSRQQVMQWLSISHFTEEQSNYACDQVGL